MNKKALGLSAFGFLVFTAPALAEDTNKNAPAKTKTEYKQTTNADKNGSSYSAEKTTKSGDVMKSTTDEEKVDKTTRKNAKGGMTTETTRKSKHPNGTGGSGKTHTMKEKTETNANGDVVKEEKKKD